MTKESHQTSGEAENPKDSILSEIEQINDYLSNKIEELDKKASSEGGTSTEKNQITVNNVVEDSDKAVIQTNIGESTDDKAVSQRKWWKDTLDEQIELLEELLEREEVTCDKFEAVLEEIERSHLDTDQFEFLSGMSRYEKCLSALEEAKVDKTENRPSTTFRDELKREATEENIQSFIGELETLMEHVDYDRETNAG